MTITRAIEQWQFYHYMRLTTYTRKEGLMVGLILKGSVALEKGRVENVRCRHLTFRPMRPVTDRRIARKHGQNEAGRRARMLDAVI